MIWDISLWSLTLPPIEFWDIIFHFWLFQMPFNQVNNGKIWMKDLKQLYLISTKQRHKINRTDILLLHWLKCLLSISFLKIYLLILERGHRDPLPHTPPCPNWKFEKYGIRWWWPPSPLLRQCPIFRFFFVFGIYFNIQISCISKYFLLGYKNKLNPLIGKRT